MSPISGSLTNKVDARITMCFGILLLVFSFYLNSNLSILTEHHYIMTALYLRGFSMGLIFTQMSTLSMLTIPRDKMAQASSISNTVRQIGGSLGVAILTTVLATRVNFHTQIFGNAIQSSSQQFSSVMGNLVTNMQSVGGSPHAAALKQAQSILLSNVSKQAYIQGIDDDFLIAAVITLLAIVPTIFLQTKQKKQSKHRAMNVKNVKIACMIFAVGSVIPAASAQIQTASDSLSLKSIIDQVIVNYPSIKKNEQDLNAANANIGLAKSTYYPNIEVTSSFARIGPTSTMTIPTLGSFSFYPANNYSAAVNLNQVIYDFGKTAQNISVENQNKELVKMSNEQLKQKLSSSVVSIYYAIAFLQEAIKIENEQLATLNEHLAFVQKKMSTGSTTSYEILTTKVKISNIENQKTDLQTTLRVQTCQLNTLLGQSGGTSLKVKPELLAVQPLDATDNTLLENAFNNREEVKLAQEKIQVSEMHIKTVHAQNNPVLNFSAAGGIKNGYIPNLNEGTMNYSVGVGLKIPIYDATRTKYNLRKTNSEIESNKQDLDLTKRAIENEVVDCEADVRSALKKIDQTSLQLKQADQAYNLALTSYKSGTITNLDLLDSSTSLSEAKLSVLKANIDYSLSFYKLKIATGEKIY
jgi:outer membrane protein TolC